MQAAGSFQKVYNTLRIAVVMCFIGHGTFGIITKSIWCNYFGVFGIGDDLAYLLMPVLGGFDIILGILMLAWPVRAIPAWLLVWGFVTALLRPLSGESFAEFIERAGNFGAPLAMLVLAGFPKNTRGWFTLIRSNSFQSGEENSTRLISYLKIILVLVLVGHGWLNLVEKKSLLQQYAGLGFSNPARIAQVAGITEIIFAVSVLVRPLRPLVFVVLIWKIGTEMFYPHYTVFEWIERGGSYGAILALWLLMEKRSSAKTFGGTFFKKMILHLIQHNDPVRAESPSGSGQNRTG
ncbi:MAG: hypothetical protein ABI813_09450 [Bacteroidota bacterium]